MIEIKFRGLRFDGQGWVYGFLGRIQEDNSSYTYFITEDTTRHQRNVRSVTFEVIPESVGQFTGLKDKNGVDIYEGDIFDINQTVNGVSKFVILSCIGGYDVRYFYDGKIQQKYEYDVYELLDAKKDLSEKEIEVIGNIHEKPELL